MNGSACPICAALPALEVLTDGRIPEKLTARERDIVQLVGQGFRNRDIAAALGLSEQTVKNNLRVIFEKLGVYDRLSLAFYSLRMGGAL